MAVTGMPKYDSEQPYMTPSTRLHRDATTRANSTVENSATKKPNVFSSENFEMSLNARNINKADDVFKREEFVKAEPAQKKNVRVRSKPRAG